MQPITAVSFPPHILQALKLAIERQTIDLVYQGQNALPSQKLVGMEALCRLPHDPSVLIAADQFIPLAEQTGLIAPLERLVFAQVARDLPSLLAHYPAIRISINLSIRHITDPAFSTFIHAWLDALPIQTVQQLDFEITETYFQHVSTDVVGVLQTLRKRGIRIVMDDFGSGQSSLSRLHTLPFDVLKLDKQFAQQIDHPMVYAIVKAAIGFAREFGIELIAEGVETMAQVKTLQSLGCPILQGFFFSRPQAIAQWLT